MRAVRIGTVAVLAVGAVLGGGAPATAAEVPGDVQVAWAGPGHQHVRVTWTESMPTANTVQIRTDAWTGGYSMTIAADAPNEVLFPALYISKNTVGRMAVNAASAPGEPAALSADFDTALPATPVVTSATGRYDDQALVEWRAGTPPVDSTPGDPLDLPQPAVLFQLGFRYPGEAGWSPVTELDTATSAVGAPSLPERRNYHLAVLTSANEWGPADPEQAQAIVIVHGTDLTAGWAGRRTLAGTVGVFDCFFACDDSAVPVPQEGRPLVLEALDRASGEWRQVATTVSGAEGRYTFGNLGPRDVYRVVAPPRSSVNEHGVSVVDNGRRTAQLRR